MIAYHYFQSPLGQMLLASQDDHLFGLWFEDQKYHPTTSDWQNQPADPLLREAATQMAAYFNDGQWRFTLPLSDQRGTPFQRDVWQALREIPVGQTVTYGELARVLGRPRAVRAVGAAVGRNPFSVVVPCHRVVGANGSLTGYAGGLARKAELLALEGVGS